MQIWLVKICIAHKEAEWHLICMPQLLSYFTLFSARLNLLYSTMDNTSSITPVIAKNYDDFCYKHHVSRDCGGNHT